MGVPLLVSSRGYALFLDNPGDAVLSVGRSDAGLRVVYTAEAEGLRCVRFELLGATALGGHDEPGGWAARCARSESRVTR